MISNEQLQAVLDEHVPAELQGDFELRAICHSIAAIRYPVSPSEARLFSSPILMPADSPEEEDYFKETGMILLEACDQRLMWRIGEIQDAVLGMFSIEEEADPVAEQ